MSKIDFKLSVTGVKIIQFATIFKNLKNITKQIKLVVTEEELNSQGLDDAHCMLYTLNLKKAWFDEYESKNVTISVNCEFLGKIMNCVTPKTKKLIFQKTMKQDYLEISIINEGVETGKKSILNADKDFKLPLIDMELDDLSIPEMDVDDAQMLMRSGDLSVLIQELSAFGEDIVIGVRDDEVILSTDSVECGETTVSINTNLIEGFWKSEGDGEDGDGEEELKFVFSLSRLNKILKFTPLSKSLTITIWKENPMCIRFPLEKCIFSELTYGDDDELTEEETETQMDEFMEKKTNALAFYIAPRMDID